MNLPEYLIVLVLAAIMGAGLPGPGDASLIAAATVGRQPVADFTVDLARGRRMLQSARRG
jgi:hypothetical protein